MKQSKTDNAKYGDVENDVIAQSLKYSADFCAYNCVKYMTRVVNVSKMNPFRRNIYKIMLHKGGCNDIKKINYYMYRLSKSRHQCEYLRFGIVMDSMFGSKKWRK